MNKPNKNNDVFDMQKEIEYVKDYYNWALKPFNIKHEDINKVLENVIDYTKGIFKDRFEHISIEVDKEDPTKINIDIPIVDLMYILGDRTLEEVGLELVPTKDGYTLMPKRKETEMILPAGKYVISDPCYVLEDSHYHRLLKATDYFGGRGGIFKDTDSDLKFCVFGTAYGDGTYFDNKGREYGVDAGCIGCIPYEMCDKSKIGQYSYVEGFVDDFEVRNLPSDRASHGNLFFGSININTASEEEDCDYEHDDYYDEDDSEDE